MLISSEMKKYCRELLTVITGKEAVEACRNNPDIDLILMDMKICITGRSGKISRGRLQ
jgi:CheY-like chemotaxis protein